MNFKNENFQLIMPTRDREKEKEREKCACSLKKIL